MANVTYENKDKNLKDGVHNKFTDADANNIKAAVNSKADASAVAALANPFRGPFNFTAGAFPTTGGTGAAGAVQAGNVYDAVLDDPNTPVTIDGVYITHGAQVRARVDAPGQTGANWKATNA